jgi:hypothetical protein
LGGEASKIGQQARRPHHSPIPPDDEQGGLTGQSFHFPAIDFLWSIEPENVQTLLHEPLDNGQCSSEQCSIGHNEDENQKAWEKRRALGDQGIGTRHQARDKLVSRQDKKGCRRSWVA